jgi:hypothetical protein
MTFDSGRTSPNRNKCASHRCSRFKLLRLSAMIEIHQASRNMYTSTPTILHDEPIVT